MDQFLGDPQIEKFVIAFEPLDDDIVHNPKVIRSKLIIHFP